MGLVRFKISGCTFLDSFIFVDWGEFSPVDVVNFIFLGYAKVCIPAYRKYMPRWIFKFIVFLYQRKLVTPE